MSEGEIDLFDIKTAAEWQRLGANAENRTFVTVNPEEVPAQFQHLIPFVIRWGMSCDVTRGDYFEKQPQRDIDEFYQAILPHCDALNAWVDDLPGSDAKLDFMIMLKAWSEAVPPPSPEEIAERRQREAAAREAKRNYWREIARRKKS